jgi:lipopolysaccharide export system permease protein
VKITLQKYILTEMVPIFISSLVVFGFIMLGTRMLSVTELVVNQGVGPGQVARLIFFLLPGIIFFALPAASLMASLLAFIRLSSDNEIIALKSSGISLYQLLPPVIMVSVIAFIIANITAFVGLPWGNRSLKDMVLEIAQSRADVGLKERVFSQPFDDVIFYVSDLSAGEKLMKDVFVVDKRDRSMTYTIIASEGRMLFIPESRSIVVRFTNGTIFIEQRDIRSVKTVRFRNYDLKIGLEDIMESLAVAEKAPKEMAFGEILKKLKELPPDSKKRNEILVELLERLTLPIAVLFLGVIGVPLGTHMKSRGFSFGIGISLVVFLIYYMIFMGVRSVCETGEVSPTIGMWLPNIFLAASCIYLFQRIANERPLPLSSEGPLMSRVMGFSRVLKEKSFPRIDSVETVGPEAVFTGEGTAVNAAEEKSPPYIGNIRLKRFHRADCRFADKIVSTNRSTFSSREEADEARYRPCEVCKP